MKGLTISQKWRGLFWVVFVTEMGGRERWESGEEKGEVSNSNIVPKGWKGTDGRGECRLKALKKRLILTDLAVSYSSMNTLAWRVKAIQGATSVLSNPLRATGLWSFLGKTRRHRQTNRYGNKSGSQRSWKKNRKARNSCLFLAPEPDVWKSISSLSHLAFQSQLLWEVNLKLLVFALSGGEKKGRSELVLLTESCFL